MRKKILIITSFAIGLVMLLSFSVQQGNDTYEFLPLLSQYELYQGTIADLDPADGTELYEMTSHLFVDYSEKQRLLRIPDDAKIISKGDGLPEFPNGTILVKTFFYFIDAANPSLGKNIVETRLMVKADDGWNFGTYEWNERQTDAVLAEDETDVKVPYKDKKGNEQDIFFHIPSNEQCAECHQHKGKNIPIGLKLRNMNFDVVKNGASINQLEYFKNIGWLDDLNHSELTTLPNWEDTSQPLEIRARAYMDMNCAHCHNPEGTASNKRLDFNYETDFAATGIQSKKEKIMMRILSDDDDDLRMPSLGITINDVEGNEMVKEYLNSLPDN